MGVNISHDCWNGSCTRFNQWRERIAELAGYPLQQATYQFHGHRGQHTYTYIAIDDVYKTHDTLVGIWTQTPPDPLVVLFAHADWEGSIYPPQQAPLADALEEILDSFTDDYDDVWLRDYTLAFIKGLRAAHARNEIVTFT